MIKNHFINDILSDSEYMETSFKINNQVSQHNKLMVNIKNKIVHGSNLFNCDNIRDLIVNVKLNWNYLNNKERQLFLERFIEKILVNKNTIVIKEVKFKIC